MADVIKHQGRVVGTSNGVLTVQILQSSACSSCSAAKLCQSSETKEKLVDVHTSNAAQYAEGDCVTVVGSVKQGLKATWWAYVLPLILVVICIVVPTQLGWGDAIAAVFGLGVLIVYYSIMYTMRSRFERRFSFTIE